MEIHVSLNHYVLVAKSVYAVAIIAYADKTSLKKV